jgi:hypothetical protein
MPINHHARAAMEHRFCPPLSFCTQAEQPLPHATAQVEDLHQIQRLLQERDSMRRRVGSGAVLTDGKLTISDVPTLVKMIKDTVGPAALKAAREEEARKGNGHAVVEAHTVVEAMVAPPQDQTVLESIIHD